MAVIAGKGYPIRDCGKKRPSRRLTMQSGHVLYERLPAVPSLRAIDPAGFIVDIPLHNGGENKAPGDPYRQFMEFRKRRVGFIPADRCPLNEGPQVRKNLPPHLRDRDICKTANWALTIKEGSARPVWVQVDPKPSKERRSDAAEVFPLGVFCQCVKDIVEFRQSAHERIERGRKDAATTVAEMQARATQKQADSAPRTNEMMVQVLGKMIEMQSAGTVPAAPAPRPTLAVGPPGASDVADLVEDVEYVNDKDGRE